MADRVVMEGLSEFGDALKKWIETADRAAQTFVAEGGVLISNAAKRNFDPRPSGSQRTSQKSGNIYYVGAPQYPSNPPRPTSRSGNLRNSIKVQKVTNLGPTKWQSDTGPSVEYAGYVEFGTSRSRKFPYMQMGVAEVLPDIEDLYQRKMLEATK